MSKERCPFENTECPYFFMTPQVRGVESGCFSDEHHLYWPRPEYVSKAARKFRNDPENKTQLCRQIHDEVHAEAPPYRDTPKAEILTAIGEITIELGLENGTI